ncbi:hypothetical protein [Sporosarcina sp. FA9]|uniref:hypothetical protein n=1 Tax=Sporosarcina sp. FA9 TaxID=3413030 RepID=UPI003F65863A
MKCLKCGVSFDEDEIFMIIEDEEDPICDLCGLNGDIYLITYGDNEFAVQELTQEKAMERWKTYVQWMELAVPDEKPSVRKIEYFVPIQ